METNIKTTEDLYQLFFGKDLVNLSKKNSIRRPKSVVVGAKSVGNNNNNTNNTNNSPRKLLTPISKAIYNKTSPRSKPYILRDLVKDNEDIETLENLNDTLDPDYEEKMENTIDTCMILLEPMIMALLGVLIGGLVIGLYLPIFNMGSVF